MLKKSMKIVCLLLAIMMVFAVTSTVFAEGLSTGLDFDSVTLSASTDNDVYDATSQVANTAIGIIQLVGMAIAVIMLVVLAIKYISAAPGDKAEIKKHAVVYIVGAVVLFGATGLLEIIKNFAEDAL